MAHDRSEWYIVAPLTRATGSPGSADQQVPVTRIVRRIVVTAARYLAGRQRRYDLDFICIGTSELMHVITMDTRMAMDTRMLGTK